MKTIRKVILPFVLLITVTQSVMSQDYLFSQFYANPLYLNPALAGSIVCPRFNLGYRNQYPALPGAFSTVSASYDQYFDALHGGIGIMLLSDRQGIDGALATNMVSATYAYRLNLNNKVFINAGLQVSLINNAIQGWDKLTFPDMIDPIYGFINNSTTAPPENESHTFVDFNAGLVAYGNRWYAGAAVSHLTTPNNGFYGVAELPLKMTVHAGALFNVKEAKRSTSPLGIGSPVISPNIIYQNQLTFNYLNYGVYLDWMPFMLGAWFRQGFENPDALIFYGGVQFPSFKIGYSYDLTISKLANHTGGAHEVTMGIQLPCPEKKKKITAVVCPTFY